MLRPPGPQIDALVDASVQAHAGATVERRFQASQLPRLSEAGIAEPADLRMTIRFSNIEGRIAMDGKLSGYVTMTCQRCMQPAKVDVSDEFQLLIVESESEQSEQEDVSGAYELVAADPARLDLRWLAEEQALLSVPLVAKHADENCATVVTKASSKEESTSQRPFANLRDMLRDK